jgi:hypothetical protein
MTQLPLFNARFGDPRLPKRFWDKVKISENTYRPDLGPCWEWIASRCSFGYGNFYWEGRVQGAHRIAYEILVGPIAAGLETDHLCTNPPCVNPNHLEPVTRSENCKRGNQGVYMIAMHHYQTHCFRGHPLDESNTFIDKKGKRSCRICRRAAVNKYAKRKREERRK